MQYVFNPRNKQINPVTPTTHVDPTLRDKVISPELYALVCKGKVSTEDIASIFAVGKSPEILVKNTKAVKNSPVAQAPANTAKVSETVKDASADAGSTGNTDGEDRATADSAFDGRELSTKTQPDLLILAGTMGIDVNAEGFAPTRQNLMKAIRAKAKEAEEKAKAPAAPAEPVADAAEVTE